MTRNEYLKNYYQSNKEKILTQSKKWKLANPERAKKLHQSWNNKKSEKYRENPKYRQKILDDRKNHPNRTDYDIKNMIRWRCKDINIKRFPPEIFKLFYIYYLGLRVSGLYSQKCLNKDIEYARGWLTKEDEYERKRVEVS